MSNQSDFTVITNGIDNKIKIIKHNETGYYNISKVNKLIHNNNNNPKQIREWFSNKSNIDLIGFLQNKLNNDNLYFKLKNGIEFQYHGTYVHRYLYDHILMWINKEYAIEISIILDNIHTLQNKKKDELIIEQNSKIDEQTKKINELIDQNNDQTKKINELLGYAKDTKIANEDLAEEVSDLNTNVNNLTDKVEEVREEFRENIENINPPPEDNDNLHMFAVLQYKNETNKLKVVRDQNKHLSKSITKDMNILIEKSYHPNPIDMFIMFKDQVNDMNNTIKSDIVNKYKRREFTINERREKLKDHKSNPPIKVLYNTIIINFNKITIAEVIDVINACDNKRRETRIP